MMTLAPCLLEATDKCDEPHAAGAKRPAASDDLNGTSVAVFAQSAGATAAAADVVARCADVFYWGDHTGIPATPLPEHFHHRVEPAGKPICLVP